MTYNNFINKLIEYYGKPQNKIVNDAVMSWIIKSFKENNNSLNTLLVGVIKKHKYNFGFPDLATIIEIYNGMVSAGEFVVKVFTDNKELNFSDDDIKLLDSPLKMPDVRIPAERQNATIGITEIVEKTLDEILKGEKHG